LKNKQDREDKGNGKQPGKSVEASIVETESGGDCFEASNTEQRSKNEWILDSGCTFHMSHNREWFTTYEPVYHGLVLMGNDAQCKIKTHDGIVRPLTGVRYVLELKWNLISLGTLKCHGCRYSTEGGVLKVSKGALVLLKAIRCDSLYVLQGSIVTGSAIVASPNKDNTKLWHMRLGHMSEKGILILKKKGHLGNHYTGKVDFYENCIFGKQKKVSFSKAIYRTKGTLDYIYSFLWGP